MNAPLVSVVCLCYNHERFVSEAIRSVLQQSYKNIQIIVVDDASTDNSSSVIRDLCRQNPEIEYIALRENVGNCAAFNKSIPLIKGDFIIDFATDDVMMPERIEHQVNYFNTLDPSYGVVFTDALYIDEYGEVLRKHYESLFRKGLLKRIPQGDVYTDVVSTFFIASPTMMSRRSVFDSLEGYDESLSYEDFDFWIRSARNFKYAFLDEITTKIRVSKRSLSTGWYKPGDTQLHSTWLVCKKAMQLSRGDEDRKALIKRLKFEIRQSVFSENHREAELFHQLLKEMDADDDFTYKMLMNLNKLKLPLASIRTAYHRMRYGK